tara:strand:- start:1126 stop:1323 length:198 start_codon:yes stop_codon:yes gene_type:complete
VEKAKSTTLVIMDTILHFIKHALGLCGEPHPSLLMGGMGIIGYCVHCIKNKIKLKKDNKNAKTNK